MGWDEYHNVAYWADDMDLADSEEDLPPRRHVRGCKGKPVVRMNSRDKTKFYGCSNWPRCTWTKPYYPSSGPSF